NAFDACGFRRVADVSASALEGYLATRRKQGWSARSSNHCLGAIRQFFRWMVMDRRIDVSPVAHLRRLNEATDRRHVRRAHTSDELERLIEAAAKGMDIEGVSGPDRAMLYALAAWTGLRRKELASLTVRSLNLESNPPTVTVSATCAKNSKQDTIPLHPLV